MDGKGNGTVTDEQDAYRSDDDKDIYLANSFERGGNEVFKHGGHLGFWLMIRYY